MRNRWYIIGGEDARAGGDSSKCRHDGGKCKVVVKRQSKQVIRGRWREVLRQGGEGR